MTKNIYIKIKTHILSKLCILNQNILAGGMASFPILVNSIVHIVMYAYYQIASMGPQYHKLATKYKKYVTIIQLVIIF